jgi:LDH2 family malate/lactate/ureidoglycolate dehydrogenase
MCIRIQNIAGIHCNTFEEPSELSFNRKHNRSYYQRSSKIETSVIRFPGENVAKIRDENQKEGIPVNREIWEKILGL